MIKIKQFIVALFLVIASGCDQVAEIKPSGQSVKIGFIGNIDETAAATIHSLQGIQVVQKDQPLLNNGDKIVLVIKDQGNDEHELKKVIHELVTIEKVSAILISSKTRLTKQTIDYADSFKLPIMALVPSQSNIDLNTRYIFQLGLNNKVQASVAAFFFRDELLIDKAAIFVDRSNPDSSFLANKFKDKFTLTNGELMGVHTLSELNKKTLQQLKNKQTEALYLALNAQAVLNVTRLLDELDWSPKIMVSNGLIDIILSKFKDEKDLIDGIYTTELYSDSDEYATISDWGLKLEKLIKSNFENASTFTALGAEAYALLTNAMNQCIPSSDQQCITNKLLVTKKFEGFMTRISISKNGKTERPVFISKIENGFLLPIVKVY
jgi:branched-chain amino acid transport system substrate-binding protein